MGVEVAHRGSGMGKGRRDLGQGRLAVGGWEQSGR